MKMERIRKRTSEKELMLGRQSQRNQWFDLFGGETVTLSDRGC